MPDSHNPGACDYSVYDTMTDDELRRILRDDANKPEGAESDIDLILYVMEVLARRRNERNEGRNPEQALESFKKYYHPDSEAVPERIPTRKKSGRRWKQGLTAAAAALAIVIGGTASAGAFGADVLGIVARWTEDTFYFASVGGQTDGCETEAALPCTSLQEMLDMYEITQKLVPTWLPAGYDLYDERVTETPIQQQFDAAYQCGDELITIGISNYLGSAPLLMEKSDSFVEIYRSGGVDYYIFANNDMLCAAWIKDNFECAISGPLTIEQMKKIVDSIEKG